MTIANTDWYWETDRNGRLLCVNQPLRNWLGIGQLNLMGKSLRQIFPAALWKACRDAYVALEAAPDALTFDYEHFDKPLPMLRRRVCCRFPPSESDRVIWYGYDIGQYYDMLQDLQAVLFEIESEREAMHEHAIIARVSQRGQFLYVSEPFAKQCGWSARELQGEGYRFIDAQFEGEPDRDTLLARLLGGMPWKGEVVTKARDGSLRIWQTSIIPLRDSDGHLQELFHISHDITGSRELQRVLAEQNERLEQAVAERTRELADANANLEADVAARAALTAERTQLASIVENTTDIVGISDARGRVLYMNRAGRRFFGIPEDEDIRDTLTPDYLPSHASSHLIEVAIPAAFEHGSWVGESSLYAANDEEVPVSLLILVKHCEDGRVEHFTSIARDIRDMKRTERTLRAQNETLERLNHELENVQHQLIQSEKMASIGQLAAGVAHEINNPIGYVNSNIGSLDRYIGDLLGLLQGYEQTVEREGGEQARTSVAALRQRVDMDFLCGDIKLLIDESKEGIGRVRKIVQDLKDFSRVDTADQWEYADLRHCLDSTLNIVWNELKYKAELVREYGELPNVQCLPSQLNQVFLNMLVNAAQALDRHGTIHVRTRRDGGHVWVEIEDDGQGMAPEVRKRIFEPFYTTKPVGQGTGLGLSLSYSIIRKHHGRIEVDSEPGRGTCFRIQLPIDQPAESPLAEEESS